MKTNLFSILFMLLISIPVINSQYSGVQSDANFIEYSVSNLENTLRNNGENVVIDLSKVKGSPYENDSFVLGKAVNKKINNSKPYYLRYNAYNDIIEIKEEDNAIGLIKSMNIYAIMNNKEYYYEIFSDDNSKSNEGYFILVTKGENSNLYLRKIKDFKDKEFAKDSFHKDSPAKFVDSELYYIKKNRILFPVSNKKNEFLNQFSEKENELKKYMKVEKINLKSEKDLIKLFKYYDSILK